MLMNFRSLRQESDGKRYTVQHTFPEVFIKERIFNFLLRFKEAYQSIKKEKPLNKFKGIIIIPVHLNSDELTFKWRKQEKIFSRYQFGQLASGQEQELRLFDIIFSELF